jgi:hypothetical protein
MKNLLRLVFMFASLLTLAISGCYYDSEEGLYYENCDTSYVTYNATILPIFNGYCISCHKDPTPTNYNIALGNYDTDTTNIVRISGAINHLNGFMPMPKPSGQISDCDLLKFNKWVRIGMPK